MSDWRVMPEKKLIFASSNKDKIKEVQNILSNWEVLSLLDFPNLPEVEETESTLEGNAILKVEMIFRMTAATGLPVISDDSGLFIDALDGAPGVHSARWTGIHRDYDTQNAKVLDLMKGETNRSACYRTVISYIEIDKTIENFFGEMLLEIAHKEFEKDGFSYDKITLYNGQYVNEMSLEEKAKVSSRGLALEKLLEFLNSNE